MTMCYISEIIFLLMILFLRQFGSMFRANMPTSVELQLRKQGLLEWQILWQTLATLALSITITSALLFRSK